MESALTDGVRVSVESFYLERHSKPEDRRFAFAYRITIANESERAVKLLRRHWVITDADAQVTEVFGDGVIGEQPLIQPGDSHTYSSGAVLETPTGTMEGSYEMVDGDGRPLDVAIPRFRLGRRESLH
jgi:ApaG protein